MNVREACSYRDDGECVWIIQFKYALAFPLTFISVYVSLNVSAWVVCGSVLFVHVWGGRTCVHGHAQGSTPPHGWHSECIITINEKVNGALSYISIYIWTVWAHKRCLGGRIQCHSTPKQRSLMCFCGHQILWIMTHSLNANQIGHDRPWSTVPAWKLSPTDTLK